jgi:hypothetical protein
MIISTPFEAVGAFLTVEVGSSKMAAYLTHHLDEVVQGKRKGLEMTFNVFSLEADLAKVTIAEDEDLAPGVPRRCEIATGEFRHVLAVWSELLEARGR